MLVLPLKIYSFETVNCFWPSQPCYFTCFANCFFHLWLQEVVYFIPTGLSFGNSLFG